MGKRGPKKGQGGRKPIPLDWQQIGNMCAIHCTQAEIASVVGCHIDTLNDRCKKEFGKTFSDFLKEKRQGGKASLRRKIWQQCERGNTAVLIFTAKNWLRMSDQPTGPAEDEQQEEFSITLSINDDAHYGDE